MYRTSKSESAHFGFTVAVSRSRRCNPRKSLHVWNRKPLCSPIRASFSMYSGSFVSSRQAHFRADLLVFYVLFLDMHVDSKHSSHALVLEGRELSPKSVRECPVFTAIQLKAQL